MAQFFPVHDCVHSAYVGASPPQYLLLRVRLDGGKCTIMENPYGNHGDVLMIGPIFMQDLL